jgi:hypothetical protein
MGDDWLDDHETCDRCHREFTVSDPRRSEWTELQEPDGGAELVCPHCLTYLDLVSRR